MVKEILCSDAQSQAEQLANRVASQLNELVDKKGKAVISVSGGKSPIAFFEALSKLSLDWSNIIITLVDERVVETNHQDSNANLIRQHLLVSHAKKAQFIPMVLDSYQQVSDMRINHLTAHANQNFIQPDVVILGMGEDAHTASLFPNVTDFTAVQPIIHVKPEFAPYDRLSLSLASILSSSKIYLAIGGESKMRVYEEAKKQKSEKKPISLVLNQADVPVDVLYFY